MRSGGSTDLGERLRREWLGSFGVRSFDSFNIQESGGSDEIMCHLYDWSVEAHPGEEWDGSAFLAHKPVESLGKNALAGDAVLREDRVKAALSGCGLPATVEQLNESLTDASDQIAMQADLSDFALK